MQVNTSVTPDELNAAPPVVVGEVEEDTEDTLRDKLGEANEMLKRTVILLEYVSNPDLVPALTKRERTVMDRQIPQMWALTDELDKAIDAFDEDNDF